LYAAGVKRLQLWETIVSTSLSTTHPGLDCLLTEIARDTSAREQADVKLRLKQANSLPSAHSLASAEKPDNPWRDRIAIKANGRILFIDIPDIVALEAEGNYVRLYRRSSAHFLRESISVAAEKLRNCGFLRIHRSVLVNAAMVAEVKRLSTGEHLLRLNNGKEYTVTRKYKKNLRCVSLTCIGGEL
jgi:DNA-binding LytR/AlgR family response regulator